MGNSRNVEIDVLRSLGMLLIIIAHIKAPYSLTVFRCFDVPLMVYVSGLCYGKKPLMEGVLNFYKKRILRLIIPTWLFLSVLFIIERIMLGPLELEPIIKSYLFYYNDSYFSYMWIIKVFLLIMLITPLLISIVSKCSRLVVYLIMIGLILVEEILAVNLCGGELKWQIFEESVPYLIGYSVFFVLGMLTKSYNEKEEILQLVCIGGICAAIFICWYIQNGEMPINNYKYPPRFLYIVYGCIMPLILWWTRRLFRFEAAETKGKISKYVLRYLVFVGQNTLWLYLWHIPLVLFSNHFINQWYIKYFVVLAGCSTIMLIQTLIVKKIENRVGKIAILRFFLG